MYKVFEIKSLVVLLVWLTIGVSMVFDLVTDVLGLSLRMSFIPLAVWGVISTVAFNPVWRFFWKRIPILEKWAFPDLNGFWDVELKTNWSRQEQLMFAAKSKRSSFDILACDEDDLTALGSMHLRAEIYQNWLFIKIRIWNPAKDSPIKESKTSAVIPAKSGTMKAPSLCYFYDQTNETENLKDDVLFEGAACLEYNFETRCMSGTYWTARTWQRAVNTAGRIYYTRRESN